jgi:uncharacterized damage-inducible protein DinB
VSEIARIVDQMDRAFSGDSWHGPSLIAVLEGISAEDASKHPVAHAHSIWELVHHIRAWNGIVQRRLNGESVEATPEMDWPPVWEATEVAWKRALDDLRESRARLCGAVEQFPENRLSEKPGNSRDSAYVMLHGLVQHDLYHAGQIAVLKKAFQR